MLHSGRMRGSDTDALGSLLDDLGGMEANAFSRPKTLVGMRDSERSTKTTMSREGSFKARESTTNPTVTHSRQSEVSKQSTRTNVDQFSAYHESVHSLDQLEDMLSNAHVEAEATRKSRKVAYTVLLCIYYSINDKKK